MQQGGHILSVGGDGVIGQTSATGMMYNAKKKNAMFGDKHDTCH